MDTIESIVMATTITVSERTRRRLAGYKHGEQTFDTVLNALMDAVPVEDVAAIQIAEHYRRMNDPRPMAAEEFVARLRRTRKAPKRG